MSNFAVDEDLTFGVCTNHASFYLLTTSALFITLIYMSRNTNITTTKKENKSLHIDNVVTKTKITTMRMALAALLIFAAATGSEGAQITRRPIGQTTTTDSPRRTQ